MKIIVIGGSIGGLNAGIALHCKGYHVEIYERSISRMQDRGAGLVIQPDMMGYLTEHNISTKRLFGVPALERQVLNNDGKPTYKFSNDTTFTSWNYIWQQLKDYFPNEKYHYGYELENIEQDDKTTTATFSNGEKRNADLIIGADGYNSICRKFFLPNVQPKYAGYIAYRGLVSEADMATDVIDFFKDKFSIYPYQNSHMLCYLVPGKNGELTEGNRQYNWVWYVNKSEKELTKILIDKNGENRKFAVPPTFMNDKSIDDLHRLADQQLPKILRDRIFETKNPFVQVVVDLSVQKMYEGKVAILGDAAFAVRPHTASGTAKAYRDAVALANCLYFHNSDIKKSIASLE